jgi:two-component system, OmpR family, response regulator BaeR
MNTPQTSTARRILVVEDDAKIADMLTNYLHMAGYATEVCGNGLQAVARVRAHAPALVLLDLMLPGLDGLAVCQAVRQFSRVPIIMVTARVDEIDRLLGLDTGADDYICKPFSPREVVARIKALLRRAEGTLAGPESSTDSQAFQVNEAGQAITWGSKPLGLTPVEFRLLRLLLSHPGQVFARARLLDSLHEDMRDTSDRAIDSHIKNLRRKLEQAGAGEVDIASVYGVGYRLDTAT